MKDREELIADFLNKNGWGNAERRILAADASFRIGDDGFVADSDFCGSCTP